MAPPASVSPPSATATRARLEVPSSGEPVLTAVGTALVVVGAATVVVVAGAATAKSTTWTTKSMRVVVHRTDAVHDRVRVGRQVERWRAPRCEAAPVGASCAPVTSPAGSSSSALWPLVSADDRTLVADDQVDGGGFVRCAAR